jgi:hypothetical protein
MIPFEIENIVQIDNEYITNGIDFAPLEGLNGQALMTFFI